MKQTLFAISVALVVTACKGSESAPSPSSSGTTSNPPAAESKSVEPKPEPKPVEVPPTPFVSEAGRYTARVTFGAVTEKTQDDPNGGTWQVAKWNSNGGLYMVQYIDYDSHAAAVAETAGFIPTRDTSAIKRDEAVKVGGRDGREIEMMANSTTTMYMRFLIEGKRVYKLAGATKGDADSVKKFFDGVEIHAAK